MSIIHCEYGMKDYKETLEKQILKLQNPMECPCSLDPYKEGKLWRQAKIESLTYALEMLPDQFEVARHSKRYIQDLELKISNLEQMLKDAGVKQ